jgi:hypothetical protein
MVRVDTDAHVERILAASLGDVLVASDASSFESLAGKLLLLERHQVNAVGELLYIGLLTTEVEDAELSIRDTTAVARLDVRLVFAIAIAPRRSYTRANTRTLLGQCNTTTIGFERWCYHVLGARSLPS